MRMEQIDLEQPGRFTTGRFTSLNKADMSAAFAGRLREAFDGAPNAQIARRLKANDATIHQYFEKGTLPVFDMLVEIGRVTGCSLHWLITGDGEKRVAKPIDLFSDNEEDSIRELARQSGRTFEEEVRVLALAAIELARKV